MLVSSVLYAATDGIERVTALRQAEPAPVRMRLLAVPGAGGALVDQYIAGHGDVLACDMAIDEAMRLAPPSPMVMPPGAQATAVGDAIALLRDSRCTKSVKEIAAELGISVRSLQRKFVEHVGVSPNACRAAARARIRDFLLCAGLPISEVSALMGYGGVPDFHAFVRQTTGSTPIERRYALRRSATGGVALAG